MPYVDTEDGHRISFSGSLIDHARTIFEQGLQLEAILLAHEYLEQKLNQLYSKHSRAGAPVVHRKLKNLIDLMASDRLLNDEDYGILNEFNRLRNVNSNQILNSSLTLKGAKKGDLVRAMELAGESEKIISRLNGESGGLTRKKRKSA